MRAALDALAVRVVELHEELALLREEHRQEMLEACHESFMNGLEDRKKAHAEDVEELAELRRQMEDVRRGLEGEKVDAVRRTHEATRESVMKMIRGRLERGDSPEHVMRYIDSQIGHPDHPW